MKNATLINSYCCGISPSNWPVSFITAVMLCFVMTKLIQKHTCKRTVVSKLCCSCRPREELQIKFLAKAIATVKLSRSLTTFGRFVRCRICTSVVSPAVCRVGWVWLFPFLVWVWSVFMKSGHFRFLCSDLVDLFENLHHAYIHYNRSAPHHCLRMLEMHTSTN